MNELIQQLKRTLESCLKRTFEMDTEKPRILVHITEGKAIVRLTKAPPENWVSFPAAFAVTEEGKQVFFEEAFALKETTGNEFFEFVGNFLGECSTEHFNSFFEAIFRRKDVLNVVGSLDKELVVCSTFFSVMGNGRKNLACRSINVPYNPEEIFTFSEEELYVESVGFFDGLILNLVPDVLNFCLKGSLRLAHVGPGFNDILNFFIKLLCLKGYDFTDSEGQEFCRQLVLKYCYVALDLDKEREFLESKDGVLFIVETPDGVEIELGEECFLAPEILFQPALIGMEGNGVVKEVFSTLRSWARYEKKFLLCGILGNQLRGFSERFENGLRELSKWLNNSIEVWHSESLDEGALLLEYDSWT